MHILNKIREYIKKNKIEIFSVFLIFIFGFILRLIALFNFDDLWLDELYSIYFASFKSVFDSIFELLKQDVHTPFYFILLHFWIKIFGDSPISCRFLTVLTTTPIIIFVYYFAKNLFNRKTAYFASFLIAINTYCIYYSVEARFYGISMLFSFIFTCIFLKLLNSNFEKKYVNWLYAVTFLYLMTYNISFVYVFFIFLFGLIYVSFFQKTDLKKYLKILSISVLLALPGLIFCVSNYFLMKNNFTSFSIEFFNFSWLAIYDVLENFFSNSNELLMRRNFHTYHNMFDLIKLPVYFIFVFIPVVVSIFGVINSIIKKNKNAFLIFLSSLSFLLFCFICAMKGFFGFQTRYVFILLPNFILLFSYGLSKIKIFGYVLYTLIVYLNLFYLILFPNNVLNFHYDELSSIKRTVEKNIQISSNDLVVAPFAGNILKYYFPKNTNMLDFYLDTGLLTKNSSALEFYLGENYKNIYSKYNLKDKLIDETVQNIPLESYENNLSAYINKMQSGDKIIFLSSFANDSNLYSNINRKDYMDESLFLFVMKKSLRDTKFILEKYLTLTDYYSGFPQDFEIFIYEKQ